MSLILHIPHASLRIPDYSHYLLPRDAVDAEALHLTDLYTDELFAARPDDAVIQAGFCRVYCDVERFDNDTLEPMSKFGMGATYLRCDDGRELRRLTPKQREQILQKFYEPHHDQLTNAVDLALSTVGEASIVDCHSYPATPLQCSLYRGDAQFDFNIGTDAFHTPTQWTDASVKFFRDRGFSLGVDEPYSGSIVPMKHYQKNRQLKSIMLEVNRQLYLNADYSRGPRFDEIQGIVSDFLAMIRGLD
ncbi:MAG: N-formylglutamate amidohydrolase [Bacteroidia bacterium]|nr:N-formylglutamate amidohydrolase [Bacteroidia bacterium]